MVFSWKQSAYQSGISWRGSEPVQFKWHCRGWRGERWTDNLQNPFQPVGTTLFPDWPLVQEFNKWKEFSGLRDKKGLHTHLFFSTWGRIFLSHLYSLALSLLMTMSRKCKTSGRKWGHSLECWSKLASVQGNGDHGEDVAHETSLLGICFSQWGAGQMTSFKFYLLLFILSFPEWRWSWEKQKGKNK